MPLINIFIALIVSIGFWKLSTKEQKLKIRNASRTKCVILVALTVATIFFYYKTYQVATFKNLITIKGYKGCYDIKVDSSIYNGKIHKIENAYSRDVVKGIIIVSRFSNDEIGYNDPISKVIPHGFRSGFHSYCSFVNNEDIVTKIYPDIDTLDILKEKPNIKHLYDVSLYSNTIPSIFPFTTNEENYEEGYLWSLTDEPGVSYVSSKSTLSYDDLDRGKDYDKMLLSRFISYYNGDKSNPLNLQSANSSQTINTLNFFSAADLSQCVYEVTVNSDIPVESLGMWFDIPIEVSSMDVERAEVSSRTFMIKNLNMHKGKVNDFRHFHIKFPTLSNMQLIRSLILTTLLTALLAMSASNIYFYSRKWYRKHLRLKGISIATKRKMILLWIPIGKIIIWSFIAIFIYLLIKSITNDYFSISLWAVNLIKIITIVGVILYIALISLVMCLLYKKKIYFKDIALYVKFLLVSSFGCIQRKTIDIFRHKQKKNSN